MTTYSVSELNNDIRKNLLKKYTSNLVVVGEISGYKLSRDNAYFTLKDKESAINCVIWKAGGNSAYRNGEQIIVTGKLAVYIKTGSYQLSVNKIEITGINNDDKRMKEEMEKLGYFDIKNKKVIPKFIKNIGIVTAVNGAALQDILYVLQNGNYNGNIYIYDCVVQGINCPASVCAGINYFKDNHNIDLLLITRGGGSMEDLIGFSDRSVCEAIFNCPIFTISAVGHEIDFMLSDLVADLRSPTPTFAGSYIIKHQNDTDLEYENLFKSINNKIINKINNVKNKLEKNKYKISTIYENTINNIINNIHYKTYNYINDYKTKIVELKNRLNNNNNMLRNEKCEIITSINDINMNDIYILKLNDGILKIKINIL
jgi:exodeoxyribonuclease VII large subunit